MKFIWFCSSYPGAMMIVIKTPDGRVEMHGNYMHTSAELEVNLFCEIIVENCRILMHSDWTRDEFVYREKIKTTIATYLESQRSKGRFGLIVFNTHRNMFTTEKFCASLAEFFELSIWTDEESKHLFDALDIEDCCISKVLTKTPANAGIHILSDEKFEKDVSQAKKSFLCPLN